MILNSSVLWLFIRVNTTSRGESNDVLVHLYLYFQGNVPSVAEALSDAGLRRCLCKGGDICPEATLTTSERSDVDASRNVSPEIAICGNDARDLGT